MFAVPKRPKLVGQKELVVNIATGAGNTCNATTPTLTTTTLADDVAVQLGSRRLDHHNACPITDALICRLTRHVY